MTAEKYVSSVLLVKLLVSPDSNEVLKDIKEIGLAPKMVADYENPGKSVITYKDKNTTVCGITRKIDSAGWKAIITVDQDDFTRVASAAGVSMTALFVLIGIIFDIYYVHCGQEHCKAVKKAYESKPISLQQAIWMWKYP